MVQAMAVSQPPPSAKPLIAAMNGLTKILDKVQNFLPVATRFFCFNCREVSELADIGARNECLVAGAGQNNATHCGVIPRILESCS